MENNKFYVYVYLDPRKPGNYNYGKYHFDYEPFYVGKGCGNRAYDHLKHNNYNKPFNNKIKKIQKECGFDPIIIKYQEMLQEKEAYKCERMMEKAIGRKDLSVGPLCNLQSCGEGGITGRIITEETRRKIGKHQKGKKRQPLSAETRRKMSITRSGRKLSEEWKNNIGKSNKGKNLGKKITDETRKKISRAMKGKNNPMYGKSRPDVSERNKKQDFSGAKNPKAKDIDILNIITGDIEHYKWLGEFSNKYNMNIHSVKSAFRNNRQYKGFSKII